ncbi:pentapeptide repeat-containing protein [Streptomyces sp. NPDC059744]|uniref:pentapeptide repeat-containing protein n=1 Tax=Streptomyces sp. NPDC059744 TaxID=3346929 RepID=UPI00365BF3EB
MREAVHGILRQHLSVSPIEGGASPHPMEDHWPDIDIDLRGADLRDFDFATCRVRVANFMKATFRNGSNFACAEFTEHAYFHNATFLGGVTFRGTWFGLRTVFAETTFEGRTDFQSATFAGIAFFLNVTSDGKLTFKNARASAEFNTNWGTQRAWPEGWTERPLREGELLPDALRHGGRRTLSLVPLPSDTRWLRVVKDRHHS